MTTGLDEFSTPSPTSIRVVRTFDAPVELVWLAHSKAELVQRFMAGGLIFCEIDFRVGGEARYVWKNADFEMGMTAEFVEIVEYERAVFTETYDGWPEGSTTVTATFAARSDQTTLTVDTEYLSQEARDMVIQPGFEEGYVLSYQQLDELLRELKG